MQCGSFYAGILCLQTGSYASQVQTSPGSNQKTAEPDHRGSVNIKQTKLLRKHNLIIVCQHTIHLQTFEKVMKNINQDGFMERQFYLICNSIFVTQLHTSKALLLGIWTLMCQQEIIVLGYSAISFKCFAYGGISLLYNQAWKKEEQKDNHCTGVCKLVLFYYYSLTLKIWESSVNSSGQHFRICLWDTIHPLLKFGEYTLLFLNYVYLISNKLHNWEDLTLLRVNVPSPPCHWMLWDVATCAYKRSALTCYMWSQYAPVTDSKCIRFWNHTVYQIKGEKFLLWLQ